MTPSSSSIAGRRSRWSPIALRALSILFAAATVIYTWFWTDALWLERGPAVELGLDYPYDAAQHAHVVTRIYPGGPAERAGLRVGDAVIAFDGRRVEDGFDQQRAYYRHSVGDSVRLTVVRPGQAAPLELTGVFRPNSELPVTRGGLQDTADRLLQNSLVLAFAAVGLLILLLRPEDRNVWLLACFFAGLISAFGFRDDFQTVPAALRSWVETYKGLFLSTFGPSFYFLCAVFPARSPLDRRLPWLKWVALGLGLAAAGETNAPDVSRPVAALSRLIGDPASDRFYFDVALSFLALGLVSLAANYFFAREPQTRRKIRVIFWGTVVGFGPSLTRVAAVRYISFQSPAWLEMILNVTLLLVPASFAYAVFKQRVLDIPALLQRSARYVLVQRGFLLLLCFISFGLTLAFAASLTHVPVIMGIGHSADTVLGAVFGTALLWSGTRVHSQVSSRIDRAFFRSAYDARVILENLAATSRTAPDREGLAHLLLNQLNAALQPASLVVYLATSDDELGAAAGAVPSELQTIRTSSPLLVELARQGQPWELPPAGLDNDPKTAVLAQLHSGCLVPIPGREGRLVGLLALGPRLSEEPYSGEDKRLLASVAGQAGMALENFRLAENIAEKLESERRMAREMEIARDVQTRLLPQSAPDLQTLECAGQCLQARRVGGDYYDFLEVGRDQAGLVLADVSGKGVHAALLMANLQAHLRSFSGLTRSGTDRMTAADLVRALQQVNRMVWKSTAAQHYATLFFGLYDDAARRLTYANCGHNPPLLLRADGMINHLKSTAMVIGLFEKWDCGTREIQLQPGDLVAIFSDGVTEAMRGEEEFGEARFMEHLRRSQELPVEQIVTSVFNAVQEFSQGNQSDDLTLVVARVK